ncbi:MAG TPA: serine hydrolase domain-containing protein, partial [Candidatus Hydrogenedentes bacterium]|nr:serine hydrolase domain-containing protein [Candidatus Hydrogenedentota bacterium]
MSSFRLLLSRCLPVLCLMALGARAAAVDAWPPEDGVLEAMLDPLFAREMPARNVPGAVCVIVGDGRVLFAKGYGVTDLDSRRPVDAERTLFRVASVSKLFAATAIMQLYEQGRLDLHRDINAYLTGFQAPATFPEPITSAHLLTHTAGFDDRFVGMGARTEADLPALGEYLARRLPPRVMPPGRYISYSNHGFALAGHLVEAVSGMTFADYVERCIFEPLGMTRSVFFPVPELMDDLATGYADFFGKRRAAVFDFPQTTPASSLMTTGADMARFLLAHLGLGRLGDARILDEATARAMQAQQFTQHPALPGRTFGFGERYENGLRILDQGGLIWGFISQVVLVPEKGLGIFVSHNTQSGGLEWAVIRAVLDRFFRVTQEFAPARPTEDTTARAATLSGHFRHNRHVRADFMKLATVAAEFIREIELAPGNGPGRLRLAYHSSFGRTAYAWDLVEVGSNYYRRVRRAATDNTETMELLDRGRVALERDPTGRVTHVFIDDNVYERLAWYETRPVLLAGLAFALPAVLGGALVWLVRRGWRGPRTLSPLPEGEGQGEGSWRPSVGAVARSGDRPQQSAGDRPQQSGGDRTQLWRWAAWLGGLACVFEAAFVAGFA